MARISGCLNNASAFAQSACSAVGTINWLTCAARAWAMICGSLKNRAGWVRWVWVSVNMAKLVGMG